MTDMSWDVLPKMLLLNYQNKPIDRFKPENHDDILFEKDAEAFLFNHTHVEETRRKLQEVFEGFRDDVHATGSGNVINGPTYAMAMYLDMFQTYSDRFITGESLEDSFLHVCIMLQSIELAFPMQLCRDIHLDPTGTFLYCRKRLRLIHGTTVSVWRLEGLQEPSFWLHEDGGQPRETGHGHWIHQHLPRRRLLQEDRPRRELLQTHRLGLYLCPASSLRNRRKQNKN